MADERELTVQFLGEEGFVIEFPAEGLAVSVPYTRVGDDLYQLDGIPLGVESAGFLDIIEAEAVGEGRLRFRCVAQRSGSRTHDYALPPGRIESEQGQTMLRELEDPGVYWEQVFGGLLFICVPPELDLDPTPWVKRMVEPEAETTE
jgi:hypothetical protein